MTKRKFLNIMNKQRILIVIIILVIYLGLSSENFVSYSNTVNILMQISINGIIAIGMTILLLQGEIDLSVGYNMGLVGTVIILLQGYGLGLAIVCGMLTGILVGVINGLIVTKLKLESLPVTLGMMIALNGLVLWLTKTKTIRGTVDSFLFLSNETFYSVPYVVMIFIIILLIFILIIRRTPFGRNIYAIGGNKIASRFFGINVDRTRFTSSKNSKRCYKYNYQC